MSVFFAITVAPRNRQCYDKPSKSLKCFGFYLFKNVDGILFAFSRKGSTKEEINHINIWKGKYFDSHNLSLCSYKKKVLQTWMWEYNTQWNKDDFEQIYKGGRTVGLALPFM